jgi:hypothetical protein
LTARAGARSRAPRTLLVLLGLCPLGAGCQWILGFEQFKRAPADGGGGGTATIVYQLPPPDAAASPSSVYAVTTQSDGSWGARLDIGSRLPCQVAGSCIDYDGNLSPNGQWLVLDSTRFDCAPADCLVVVSADLRTYSAPYGALHTGGPGGQTVNTEGHPAVSSDGKRVVWSAGLGSHTRDLWAAEVVDNYWSNPQVITAGSTFDYQHTPAFSSDGNTVIFDCGTQPYPVTSTGDTNALCQVGFDGSGFSVIVMPTDGPGGQPGSVVHRPVFDITSGSILFQADWDPQRGVTLYKAEIGDGGPSQITKVGNAPSDATPCVLSDGRVVSVRTDPDNTDKLIVTAHDGSNATTVDTGSPTLVPDSVGCGGPAP